MEEFVYRNKALDCDHFFHKAFVSCPTLDRAATDALLRCRDDPQARDLLIRSNLRLVYSVLKKKGYPASMENIMTGTEGLILAVKRFDPRHGTCFSTYASKKIFYQLLKEGTATSIHVSSHFRENYRKLEKAEKNLQAELGTLPSDRELAEKAGLTEEKLAAIRNLSIQSMEPVSLATPIGEDRELADILTDEAEDMETRFLREAQWECLHRQIDTLEPRKQFIIRMYFGFHGKPMSYQDIANQLGISKERVRQICINTLAELKACPDLQR